MRKIRRLVLSSLLILSVFLLAPKSTNATQLNWHKILDTPDNTSTIKIDEQNNNIIYASIQNNAGFDLLKTVDFGAHWSSVRNNIPNGSDINSITIFAGNDNVLAISLWQSGIYLSENSGLSWSQLYPSATPRSVEISPSDINTIFVGIGGNHDNNSGVYKTTNKGNTWNKLIPLADNNGEIVIDKSNGNRIFADSDPYFYRSLDGGDNWVQLPLSRAYAISVIDNQNSNTIYSAQFDLNSGIYKSVDNGDNWSLKNDGINTPYFRMAQDNNGFLYASVVGSTGGVWRSTDGAEHWENVGNPDWGTSNTWGLDAKGGRVYVSVEGFGLFTADASSSAVPTSHPIVFVPGMTASWSQKGLVDNEPTTYADWQLIPGSDYYYKPIFDTLSTTGLVMNQSMFTFGYDWTSQISQSAASLNTFLQNEVLPKNGGQKANIISHSMGGLVVAYCFEKISGCADKINKIISAGSPYQGAVDAYPLWEGGKIEDNNIVKNLIFKVLLNRLSSPDYINDASILHNKVKGLGDIMPIFNYINGKAYSEMSSIGHNSALESLANPSDLFKNSLTTLWGNAQLTTRNLIVTTPAQWEQLSGLWPDGKPTSQTFANGDNSVLDFSANLSGALETQSYGGIHTKYFRDSSVLSKILTTFNLTGTPTIVPSSPIDSVLLFILHSPATLIVKDPQGNIVGSPDSTGKAVFIFNPSRGTYKTEIIGTGAGNFGIEAFFAKGSNTPFSQEIDSTISTGQSKNFYFKYTGNSDSAFINSSSDFLQSFKLHSSQSGNKSAITISKNVEKLLLALKPSPLKLPVILAIRVEYFNMIDILRQEKSNSVRFSLISASEDLFNLLVDLDKQYGPDPIKNQAQNEIKLAQTAFDKFIQKKKFTALDLANLQLADDDLTKAKSYFSSRFLYQSYLLSASALILTK